MVLIAVDLHGIAIPASVDMIFSNRRIDALENRIKTARNSGGLNVSRLLQKAKWIGIDLDQVVVFMIRHRVVVIVIILNLEVWVWHEKSLDVGKVDEDRTGGLVAIDDHFSARDTDAIRVEDLDLLSAVAKEGEIVQIDFMSGVGIGTVVKTIWMPLIQNGCGNVYPVMDLYAP